MTYALNLADDGHVLSATYPEFAPADAPTCEALPEGDISDYIFNTTTQEFTYDPLPHEDTPETPSVEDQLAELREQNNMLMECLLEMSEMVYQ